MTPLIDKEFLDQFEASFEATFVSAWEILQDARKAGRAAFAAIAQLHAERLAQQMVKQLIASIEGYSSTGGDEDRFLAGVNAGYANAREQIVEGLRDLLSTPDPRYQRPTSVPPGYIPATASANCKCMGFLATTDMNGKSAYWCCNGTRSFES